MPVTPVPAAPVASPAYETRAADGTGGARSNGAARRTDARNIVAPRLHGRFTVLDDSSEARFPAVSGLTKRLRIARGASCGPGRDILS